MKQLNGTTEIIVAFVLISLATVLMIAYGCIARPAPPVSPIATPTNTVQPIQSTPFDTPTPLPTPTSTLTSTPTSTPFPTITPTATSIVTSTPTPTETPEVVSICRLGYPYTILPGDWLSKIAERYYGDWSKYPLIVECTNRLALSELGSRFCFIDDPDLIYPSCEVLVPQVTE